MRILGSGRTRRLAGSASLAAALPLLAACSEQTNDNPTGDLAVPHLLPGEVVTAQGQQAAGLYLPIFLVAVAIFVLVEGLLLYITFRYRRRPSDTRLPAQTHGNNLLELIWTAVPAVIVLVMFVGSMSVLTNVQARSNAPAVTVDAVAFQWQWTFEYREQGLSFTGAGRQGPEMVLPVAETVRIRLHASDVIHAFYVPQFFYKLDAVPGRINEFDVLIEKPGTYGGQCAEFCGLAHSDMYFTVRAVPRADYEAWLAEQVGGGSSASTDQDDADPSLPPVAAVLHLETSAEAPLAFSQRTLTAPAGTLVSVEYLNDSDVPHNIAFFDGPDATGERLAGTAIAGGPGTLQRLDLATPAEPGSYLFRCDVHPAQMTGTLEVTS